MTNKITKSTLTTSSLISEGDVIEISRVDSLWEKFLTFLHIRKSYSGEYTIGDVKEDSFTYNITPNKEKTNEK